MSLVDSVPGCTNKNDEATTWLPEIESSQRFLVSSNLLHRLISEVSGAHKCCANLLLSPDHLSSHTHFHFKVSTHFETHFTFTTTYYTSTFTTTTTTPTTTTLYYHTPLTATMPGPSNPQLKRTEIGLAKVYPEGFKAYSESYCEGTIAGANYGWRMTHMQAEEWSREYSSQFYISPSGTNTTTGAYHGLPPNSPRRLSKLEKDRREYCASLNKGCKPWPYVSEPFSLHEGTFVPPRTNVACLAEQQAREDGDAVPPQGIQDAFTGVNQFAPDAFPGGYDAPVAPQQVYQEVPMDLSFDIAAAQAQGIPSTFDGFNNVFSYPPQGTQDDFAASYAVDTFPVGDFQGIDGDFAYASGLEPQGFVDAPTAPMDNGFPPCPGIQEPFTELDNGFSVPPLGYQQAFGEPMVPALGNWDADAAPIDNGDAPVEGFQELPAALRAFLDAEDNSQFN
jgi:hypothetical protein